VTATPPASTPDQPPPSLPDVDQDYVQRVFSELSEMDVPLDPNPLELGPQRLREKIAEVRRMRSRCEAIFLQVSKDQYHYNRFHRLLSTELSIKTKRLIAEDPEVRAGRAAVDREALAHMKLWSLVAETERLSNCLSDLDTVMKVVKAKRSDLSDIQGRIKDQMRLCHDEITHLHGVWGSKLPPDADKTPLLPGQGTAIKNPDDLDDFLKDIEGEMHLRPDYTEDYTEDDDEVEVDEVEPDEVEPDEDDDEVEVDEVEEPDEVEVEVEEPDEVEPEGDPDPEPEPEVVEETTETPEEETPEEEPDPEAVENELVDEVSLEDLEEAPIEKAAAAPIETEPEPEPKADQKPKKPPEAVDILPGSATEADVEAFLTGTVPGSEDPFGAVGDDDVEALLNSF